MTPQPNDTIAVWFSCGAASAVAAKLTISRFPECVVRVINNPVMEEDIDNRRFLADVQRWIGVDIEIATNPNYPLFSAELLWDKRGYMAGNQGAPCTFELKKVARQRWENANPHQWLVLGFTLDERSRHDRFVLTERGNILPVLIDAQMTKADCHTMLRENGIRLPAIYDRGYPNANCIGCVKATSPTYWNHVRAKDPDVFDRRAAQSRRLGAKLARYKGVRVFLDELPPDAQGKPMNTMTNECGIFCEETS